MTTVGLLDVGPDLQLLLNPGEAFPGLVLGSPWTLADVPQECNTRANPPVPTRTSSSPRGSAPQPPTVLPPS